jgi:hypothetical protein
MNEKTKTVFGTNVDRPVPEIAQEARNKVYEARKIIDDLSFAFLGWGERLKPVEGLLTCGMVCLYRLIEEMKECEVNKHDDTNG